MSREMDARLVAQIRDRWHRYSEKTLEAALSEEPMPSPTIDDMATILGDLSTTLSILAALDEAFARRPSNMAPLRVVRGSSEPE